MTKTELQQLAEDAIAIKKAIEAIKAEKIEPLEERLKGIKVKLEREMSMKGTKSVATEIGVVSWRDRQGSKKYNEDALKKALNTNDLSEYITRGRGVSFLVIQPNK